MDHISAYGPFRDPWRFLKGPYPEISEYIQGLQPYSSQVVLLENHYAKGEEGEKEPSPPKKPKLTRGNPAEESMMGVKASMKGGRKRQK
jgi:hypothetical protein